MHWQTWLLFVATEAVMSLTPGPAVLLVISSALQSGFRVGMGAVVGILIGNAIYFVISGTSLGGMLMASQGLYTVVKYAGAAWLVWLGLNDLVRPSSGMAGSAPAGSAAIRRGLTLQLSNPKAIVFFVALLPQFIDPKSPVVMQILIMGTSSIIVEFFILTGYSFAASASSALVQESRYASLTHRVGGALLICAGLGIALLGRN